ncbi:NFACT family protein [Vallitalea pronyensis]|uniref:Rqc2 homolog RqcH n=1 Tax=Vallitalea pronyensis TaxID=1348613 RepID=A0A8J8MKD1_9FIRM|nr:NFACT RNA binding domain-containing protein [Vallitalea pronyensis]QUI22908.1 NFACT family protein [Vallitalea pronyensis]
MALDGIVISNIVYELTQKIVGGRIDKIYQPESDEIVLSIRHQKTSYKLLLSSLANMPRIHLTDVPKKNPLNPPNFCMLLRKHIAGGRVIKVIQPHFERIVELYIEHLNDLGDRCIKILIIEIMGRHSNIIFCDEDKRILDSIKHVSANISSVREVLPNRPYAYPPSKDKLDPTEPLTLNAFVENMKEKKAIILKALYFTFNGISPIISEELCYRASINSSSHTEELLLDDYERLYDAFIELIHGIKQEQYIPNIVSLNGQVYEEFSSVPLTSYGSESTITYDSISEVLDAYYAKSSNASRMHQKSSDMKKLVTTNLERCYKKLDLQLKQIKDTEDRDKYKILGELITANIHAIKEGDESLTTVNYYTNEEITIKLKPHLTPSENAAKYYDRYNKLKRTYAALTEHIQDTQSEIDHLESIQNALSFIDAEEDLLLIRQELMEYGYLRFRKNKNKKALEKSKPFHYKTSDGFDIYVGKNNLQNDELTTKVAASLDWWFHTKEVPGSHVIVRTDGKELSDTAFEEAAALAAFYSKANKSSKVAVDYTLKKHIKKPAGSVPGYVIYHTNYSMYVAPSDEKVTLVE